jgi:hypothetical protein
VADLGLSALRSQRLLLTEMISVLFKEILRKESFQEEYLNFCGAIVLHSMSGMCGIESSASGGDALRQ